MRRFVLVPAFFAVFFVLSCSDSSSSGGAPKVAQRSAVDSGDYKDCTLATVNAELLTLSDFDYYSSGTYYNGESYVELRTSTHTAVFYCPSVPSGPYKGKSFRAEFPFDVRSAGRDCMYVCPRTRSGVLVRVGDEVVDAVHASSFCLFLPLYGFGTNRIEASPMMEGMSVMPSGTYWKKG